MSTMLLIRETGGAVMPIDLTDAEGSPTELAENIARTLQHLGVTDAYWRDRVGTLQKEVVSLKVELADAKKQRDAADELADFYRNFKAVGQAYK